MAVINYFLKLANNLSFLLLSAEYTFIFVSVWISLSAWLKLLALNFFDILSSFALSDEIDFCFSASFYFDTNLVTTPPAIIKHTIDEVITMYFLSILQTDFPLLTKNTFFLIVSYPFFQFWQQKRRPKGRHIARALIFLCVILCDFSWLFLTTKKFEIA